MMSSRTILLKQYVAMACLSLILLGRCVLAESAVTCALMGDDNLGLLKSSVFELAQVELSKDSSLALLERSNIDKVLQEQSLQMAFAPEGGADRRRLGNLLKADVVVILHARGTDEVRSLDIVIAETKTGLRPNEPACFRSVLTRSSPICLSAGIHTLEPSFSDLAKHRVSALSHDLLDLVMPVSASDGFHAKNAKNVLERF